MLACRKAVLKIKMLGLYNFMFFTSTVLNVRYTCYEIKIFKKNKNLFFVLNV